MGLNCNGCDHKSNAVSDGYCSHFDFKPQVDSCMQHTGMNASAGKISKIGKPTGEYIHLNKDGASSESSDDIRPSGH